jgi:hypothetical protein
MELRQYQIDIAEKAATIIKKYGFVYLAMEVRTGKTFTALQICANLGFKKVLFVTKLKAIEGIKKDCEHYPQLDVTFINFESAQKVGNDFQIVIVDEMHSLGAFPKPSLRAKVLKEICKGKPITGSQHKSDAMATRSLIFKWSDFTFSIGIFMYFSSQCHFTRKPRR